MDAVKKRAGFDTLLAPHTAILYSRQLLHARLSLPLTALGGILLVVALLQEWQLQRTATVGILVAAVAFAVAVISIREWRSRSRGLWARPTGDPSLAAPHDRSEPDPATTAWLQFAALLIFAALVAGAYFVGVTFDTIFYWIVVYGIFHMAVYSLSLWIKLQMREQILSFAWFVLGGLYWLTTGDSVAVVLGGGWLLMGLLLYGRHRQFERLACSPATDNHSEMDAP